MKPQEFLIGIRDFFAVVVPGTIFLFLLPTHIVESAQTFKGVALFGVAIAAYLIGSVASAMGSLLDLPVDSVLESSRFRRRLGKKLAQREALATEMRRNLLQQAGLPVPENQYPESIKAFWWSHLRLNCPSAMAELDRIEATSKLFRSLVAVFVVWGGISRFTGMERNNFLELDTSVLAVAAACSAVLYAGNRFVFLGAVYRLGASYLLSTSPAPANPG